MSTLVNALLRKKAAVRPEAFHDNEKQADKKRKFDDPAMTQLPKSLRGRKMEKKACCSRGGLDTWRMKEVERDFCNTPFLDQARNLVNQIVSAEDTARTARAADDIQTQTLELELAKMRAQKMQWLQQQKQQGAMIQAPPTQPEMAAVPEQAPAVPQQGASPAA